MTFSRESLKSTAILSTSLIFLLWLLPKYASGLLIQDFSTAGLVDFNWGPVFCMVITLVLTIRVGTPVIFFYLLCCFPVYIYATLVDRNMLSGAYVLVTMYYVYFLLNIKVFSHVNLMVFKNKTVGELNIIVWLVFVILALVVFKKTSYGLQFHNIYEARFEAREYGKLFQYALVMLQNVVLPFLLWHYAQSKRIGYLLGCFFILVTLFFAAGVRNHIFLFFLGLTVLWGYKNFKKPGLALAAYTFLFLSCLFLISEFGMLKGLVDSFTRRIIFVSGYWANMSSYFNFDATSSVPLSLQMGDHYRGEGHNANLNPFNTGHIELGPYLFCFFISVASIFLVYLSRVGYYFHVTWLLFVFSNLRIQSWFLTGGLAALIILSVIYNEYQRKRKHSYLSI